MKVLNYSDFRSNLANNLNAINADKEIIIVSRPKGKSVVVMDLDEFNATQETLHLSGTAANRKRLTESIEEMNKGKFHKKKLIEK